MRKKMYWGLASLILIIGVVGVYFMLQPKSDMEPEKKFIAPSEADIEKAREANQPPREAKDGFTWEWHADHWHEVPIVQKKQGEQSGQSEPVQVFKSESLQIPESLPERGPHPPFESYKHLLDDPEATIRKNAAIIVADYHSLEARRAYGELNLLDLAIHKGYVGGSMWSDEAMKLLDLKKEVLWKPLEAAGLVVSAPVPVVEPISPLEGGEN